MMQNSFMKIYRTMSLVSKRRPECSSRNGCVPSVRSLTTMRALSGPTIQGWHTEIGRFVAKGTKKGKMLPMLTR